MSKMRARGSLLLPDADQICRRAHDNLLPLQRMRAPVERKLASYRLFRPSTLCCTVLRLCAFLVLLSMIIKTGESTSVFSIVVYICIWKRPLLTEFVLSHYDGLKQSLAADAIHLKLFLVGSDNTSTSTTAERFSAPFAVHPNSPLGAKHNLGIQSLRAHFLDNDTTQSSGSNYPHAVAVFGSDDIVNRAFFVAVRDSMLPSAAPKNHMVGLRDIFFYDLKSKRLVYTKGYRSFQTAISGTLGCGRVYSWSLLEALNWDLWDSDRQHGLDQSATRNVMRKIPMIEEVSVALLGREQGIVAVDIKSDGYKSGNNIWKFQEVIEAVGRNGRFHDFEVENERQVLSEAFGPSFIGKLSVLRDKMVQSDTD